MIRGAYEFLEFLGFIGALVGENLLVVVKVCIDMKNRSPANFLAG